MGLRIGMAMGWVLSACHGQETDEVLAGLRADNQALREEVIALRAENVVLVEAGAPAWPQTVSLKRVGGSAGRLLYQRTCPLGQALKGFASRNGSVIDSLLPLCAPVAPIAGSRGPRTLEHELAIVGGRGGRTSDSMCPGEALVIGLRGRSADVIDALETVCSGGQNGLRIGGQGGREYERLCPVGWLAVGLGGRHGDYVESLSLVCADPKAAGFPALPPPPTPPPSGEIHRPPRDVPAPPEEAVPPEAPAPGDAPEVRPLRRPPAQDSVP